ncbi:MAG: band 7 protein [Sphingomonadales bacterium]|nr:band 7 protein [Sphingomonadales bacterium]
MDGLKVGFASVVALFIFVCGISLFSCDKIDVGNVGLLVNTTSDVRGVQQTPTVSGYVWYNPFTQTIIEFPTIVQTVNWQEAEAVQFASNQGININADVAFSFRIDPNKAATFYQSFKVRDLEPFAHGYLRNQVKDAINEVASHMDVEGIYGEKKTELLVKAKAHLVKALEPKGVMVDQLTFNSPVRLPETVQSAINASIAQTQEAQRAENKVRQFQAVALQQIAEAEGAAKSAVAKAEGEAKALKARSEAEAAAILVRAEAQAKANGLIRQELTPEFIKFKMVEKWNGVLPVVGETGGSTFVDARNLIGAGK